jgi:hypothetical protein
MVPLLREPCYEIQIIVGAGVRTEWRKGGCMNPEGPCRRKMCFILWKKKYKPATCCEFLAVEKLTLQLARNLHLHEMIEVAWNCMTLMQSKFARCEGLYALLYWVTYKKIVNEHCIVYTYARPKCVFERSRWRINTSVIAASPHCKVGTPPSRRRSFP